MVSLRRVVRYLATLATLDTKKMEIGGDAKHACLGAIAARIKYQQQNGLNLRSGTRNAYPSQ